MGIMFFILIRGRNCEKYIEKCINSLYRQTYQNWRAMVVLDDPKDDSYKKALPYDGNKIYIHLNEIHKGLCQNMWHGINLIKEQLYPGPEDVICILDADDSLDPCALDIINKHYERKGCLVTYGSYIKNSKKRKKYLQDDKGNWGEAASDLGLMFTIIELAGLKNVRHISKPIYNWRDNTKFKTNLDNQKKWTKIFRSKKILSPVI